MTAPKINHLSMEEGGESTSKPKPHHRHKVNNGERVRDQYGYRLRAAAICVRDELENEVLLVTGGKDVSVWVVPGGGIELNETPAEAAIREVCEEAGVKGRLIRSLGTFVDDGRKNKTVVYVLRVSEELTNWEDRTLIGRRRQWLPMEQALCLLKSSQRPFLDAVKSC